MMNPAHSENMVQRKLLQNTDSAKENFSESDAMNSSNSTLLNTNIQPDNCNYSGYKRKCCPSLCNLEAAGKNSSDVTMDFIQMLISENKSLKEEIKTLHLKASQAKLSIQSKKSMENWTECKMQCCDKDHNQEKYSKDGLQETMMKWVESCSEKGEPRNGHENTKDKCNVSKVNHFPRRKLKRCQFCATVHLWGAERCPAFGTICENCWKPNHSADACRNKKFRKLRKTQSLYIESSLKKENNEDSQSGNIIEVQTEEAEDACDADAATESLKEKEFAEKLNNENKDINSSPEMEKENIDDEANMEFSRKYFDELYPGLSKKIKDILNYRFHLLEQIDIENGDVLLQVMRINAHIDETIAKETKGVHHNHMHCVDELIENDNQKGDTSKLEIEVVKDDFTETNKVNAENKHVEKANDYSRKKTRRQKKKNGFRNRKM